MGLRGAGGAMSDVEQHRRPRRFLWASGGPPEYPCPCCGFRVFGEPPGSHEICPVCNWEDDPVQLHDPHYAGGANRRSLREAQTLILQRLPSSESEVEGYRRDPNWRPLSSRSMPGNDPTEAV